MNMNGLFHGREDVFMAETTVEQFAVWCVESMRRTLSNARSFPLCSACAQDFLQCNQKIVSLAEYSGETNPVSTTLNNNAVHTQRVITLKLVDARYDDDELIKVGGNVFTQVYLNLTLLPFTDKHRAALRDIGESVNEEDVDRNTYESTFDKVSTSVTNT
jgi:hypothetical protein